MTFNVEAAISNFLADPVRASLELPAALSVEERKYAKKIAEKHPHIKCESYGLGNERRLHLFKQGGTDVTVKNTFINDWAPKESGEAGECPEHIIFRSVPTQFSAFLDGIGKLDLTPIDEGSGHAEEARVANTPCSTASGPASTASSPPIGSPRDVNRDLPALPEGVHVRNTFLHMDTAPVSDRIIQSMPHDMFRTQLMAEVEAGCAIPMPFENAQKPLNPPQHPGISACWNELS